MKKFFLICLVLTIFSSCIATPLTSFDIPFKLIESGAIDNPILVEESGQFAHIEGLVESSGLARLDNGLFLTHNDSFGGSKLFGFYFDGLGSSPAIVASASRPLLNFDWEDIAPLSDGRVVVADIGDNWHFRRFGYLYFASFLELPKKNGDFCCSSYDFEKVTFRYPGSPAKQKNYDAEAIFQRDGNLYLFTKEDGGSRLMLIDLKAHSLAGHKNRVIESIYLGSLELFGRVTSADYSVSKRMLAVLTYSNLYFFKDNSKEVDGAYVELKIDDLEPVGFMPVELGQCEALSFINDNRVLVSNEANRFKIFQLSSKNLRVDE